MNHEQLIASYPDDLRKHAANSGWNAANTAIFNAILDQSAKASDEGGSQVGHATVQARASLAYWMHFANRSSPD
jgi:hypothetical protein